jgi:hypothetical protein
MLILILLLLIFLPFQGGLFHLLYDLLVLYVALIHEVPLNFEESTNKVDS